VLRSTFSAKNFEAAPLRRKGDVHLSPAVGDYT
jgi:hypothetical protein